jgi:soluble lytic murein transglycosylase-like protein
MTGLNLMKRSYRNSKPSGPLGCTPMPGMQRVAAVAVLLTAGSAFGAGFSAADVPHAGLRQPGRVSISNRGGVITAYRFFGNIREALFSLRSHRTLQTTAYGPVLFDSTARVASPMPAYLSSVIEEAARKEGLDPRLVAAVAARESAYDANAVSSAGAGGIMQIMPATARFLGLSNLFDVRANVFAGTRYLRTLLDTFGGDLDLALAAYNAGPGAVQRYSGIPPYRETQQYVKIVRASYERALAR